MCKWLRWVFYANAYKMNIVWATNEYGEKVGDGHVGATVSINNAYLHFTLTVYRGCFDAYLGKDGDYALFEILMHEFCHLLTYPLQELLEEHCDESLSLTIKQLAERQTEMTAKIMTSAELHKLTEEYR